MNWGVRRTSWTDADERRFWAKVARADIGCWEWLASKDPAGYGWFFIDKAVRRAHRAAYELVVGPIPEGLVLDHLCHYTSCVRPDHLEPVTDRENLRRGVNFHAEKDHCAHGHPFDTANTYYRPDKPGRNCRACSREGARRRRSHRMSQQAS